jgi:hypothetical protein
MTDPRPDDDIHQAFFGWSHDRGGLDVLDFSFSSQDEAKRWLRKLEPHLRLQPIPPHGLPPHALSYIDVENDMAVVLRRVNLGYSSGRNNSHALIGSASTLTVPVALNLDEWPGWQGNRPSLQRMETIPASTFAGFGGRTEQLYTRAMRLEHQLAVVLAKLLDNPGTPLSIIGCPDEDRLAMVWGLAAAADTYLRQHGCLRRWSFSTYEDRHDDSIERLPEIVFLPAQPQSIAQARRTIVQLSIEAAVAGQNGTHAIHLVSHLLHDTPPPVEEPMREVVSVQPGPRVPNNSRPDYSGSALERARPVGARFGHAAQHHEVVPAEYLTQMLADLLNAGSVKELHASLSRLEQATQQPQERERLRAALDVGTVNTVAKSAEIAVRQELIERFLHVAYGRDFGDLRHPAALEHSAAMIANCESEYLARLLSKYSSWAGEQNIRAAMFTRWAQKDPASTASPSPATRTSQPQQPVRQRRGLRMLAVTVAAVLGILGVTYLLGYLNGRPEPISTGGEPSSSKLPTIGHAVLTPEENQQAFSFVQVGQSYYPQAPCAPVESGLQCTRHGTPPDQHQAAPELVAILVLKTQVRNLLTAAANGTSVQMGEGWVQPTPVR